MYSRAVAWKSTSQTPLHETLETASSLVSYVKKFDSWDVML